MQTSPGRMGGKGSTVLLGGERSEPNPNTSETQQSDAVATFAPWAGGAERALRLRLHRARDTATARATRSQHGSARMIYWLAAQMAAAKVFARVPDEELTETIGQLARLFLVAGWIERTEAPDER